MEKKKRMFKPHELMYNDWVLYPCNDMPDRVYSTHNFDKGDTTPAVYFMYGNMPQLYCEGVELTREIVKVNDFTLFPQEGVWKKWGENNDYQWKIEILFLKGSENDSGVVVDISEYNKKDNYSNTAHKIVNHVLELQHLLRGFESPELLDFAENMKIEKEEEDAEDNV